MYINFLGGFVFIFLSIILVFFATKAMTRCGVNLGTLPEFCNLNKCCFHPRYIYIYIEMGPPHICPLPHINIKMWSVFFLLGVY